MFSAFLVFSVAIYLAAGIGAQILDAGRPVVKSRAATALDVIVTVISIICLTLAAALALLDVRV